jgi:hypothetical protein
MASCRLQLGTTELAAPAWTAYCSQFTRALETISPDNRQQPQPRPLHFYALPMRRQGAAQDGVSGRFWRGGQFLSACRRWPACC